MNIIDALCSVGFGLFFAIMGALKESSPILFRIVSWIIEWIF